MDIFIKSFNRPYHLDRCLYSIKKFVEGYTRIIILDDGTPEKYLAKIQQKYPEVIIKKSEFYDEKSQAIENNSVDKAKLKFPGKFWHREISQSSDYFFLLEDDFFIVHAIDLTSIAQFMAKEEVFQYKLIWQGRNEFTEKQIQNIGGHQLINTKKRFFSSENFRRLSHDKFKLRRVLGLILGNTNTTYFKYFMLAFYKYYTVAGAVLDKRLFAEMWRDVSNLNESTQIYRMLKLYEDKGLPLRVGKAVTESVETTYLTSATNEFKGVNLSVFDFNHIINEAWYDDKFDAMYRFPQDHGKQYFKDFLPIEMHQPFDEWVKEFSFPYANYGCRVITD